jgi:sugar lactone lactonase YvrE
MQPEMIADYACEVGEGPLWHPTEKRLYWADIPAGRLFRYDPATGRHEKFFDGGAVGGFTFQADGALLLFMAFGRVASLRDDTLTDVIPKIPGEEEFRFNDVMADPEGRVFCGTIHCTKEGTEKGRLYRLDNDGTATVVLDGVGISNGMGYTPDLKQMYFTDSIKGIDIFDYDRATGEISNRRPLVARQEGQGFLDGMTVDVDGNIWSARWGDAGVFGYTPGGEGIRKIEFPTDAVSSVTFGGDDYADMYVTTAGGHDKAKNGPTAGALFRTNIGVGGRPEFLSRVGL